MWRYKCQHCSHVFEAPAGVVPECCPECGCLYFARVK